MRFSYLAIPALALSVAACSSEVSLSSGLDGNKKISELTAAEATSLCEAAAATAEDFFNDNKTGTCKFAAAFIVALAGGGEAECEAAVTSCQDAPAEPTTSECNVAEIMDPTCEATISEVETCYNDSLSAASTVLSEIGGLSCGEIVDPTTTINANVTDPASCATVEAKCPNFDLDVPTVGTSTGT